MSYFIDILKIIFSWPTVVVVIFLVLKKDISNILNKPNLSEISIKDMIKVIFSGQYQAKKETGKDDESKEIKINTNDFLVNKISQIVIEFATDHPNYKLVPEALSKVVDMVHYGSCTDKQSGEYAKRAFQLLHTNYSSSYWAKQTPYWYE